MNVQKTDLVSEYLREVELRLSGLPLLERRELLADLEVHISAARETGAYSESEMIEVLRRLGSPEEVAAAAYWEAGPQAPRREPAPPPAAPASRTGIPGWVFAVIAGVVVFFLIGAVGLMAVTQVTVDAPPASTAVVPPEPPPAPEPPR